MDRADLTRVNALYEEARSIATAIHNFDNGGRIVAMTVSAPEPAPMPPSPDMIATVMTGNMQYPPEMVMAIKTALEQRRAEIVAELTQLGLTGVE